MRIQGTTRGNRALLLHSRAAFTLIEMLAVIVILSILAYALVVNLSDAKKAVEADATKTTMQKISLACHSYNDDKGDFPPSKFTTEQGTPPNDSNLGSECLYLALCAEKAPGESFENLSNTDEDQTVKRMPGFQVATLFELHDQWDNPIAYFNHRDYGREDVYVGFNANGDRIESRVHAIKNDKTGKWFEPIGFQLISPGPDGAFGTPDDVFSFNYSNNKK